MRIVNIKYHAQTKYKNAYQPPASRPRQREGIRPQDSDKARSVRSDTGVEVRAVLKTGICRGDRTANKRVFVGDSATPHREKPYIFTLGTPVRTSSTAQDHKKQIRTKDRANIRNSVLSFVLFYRFICLGRRGRRPLQA